MANKTSASQAVSGMVKGLHPLRMKEGFYDFMLNGQIEGFDGNGLPIIQNEPSNLKCTGFPDGYYVTGFVNIVEQERIIWFLSNPSTGNSQIGESRGMANCKKNADDPTFEGCDDCGTRLSERIPLEEQEQNPCCQFRTIQVDECFNFTREFPVNSIEYQITDCGIELYLADGNNARRYLVLEYINGNAEDDLKIKQEFYEVIGFESEPCDTPIYGTSIDCNRMKIQPTAPMPCIDFVDLVGGGNNKAGSYQFFIAYADKFGNKRSSYFSSTNPIPIRTRDVTVQTDYETDRAIKLEIQNLDPLGAFQYYVLAVAKTMNSFTAFYKVPGVFPVTQDFYTYTGNIEGEEKLTAGDIFQRFPHYTTAGHVTSSNNILYWANVKEEKKLNLQRVANKIKVYWQTIAIPEQVYRNPRNVNKFRSAMRDEVYPYGVQFLIDGTIETSVFHIPGREAVESDLEIVNNDDAVRDNICDECSEPIDPDEQLIIDDLNETTCEDDDDDDIDLILDNSFQPSGGCPLVEHTDTGCTPDSGSGTAPSVNAGADQIINYLAIVSLDGIVVPGSNEITSILWTQLSGPNTVTINNPGTLNTFFSNYHAGTYEFQLCVSDNGGWVVVDTIEFTIDIPVNEPPVCDPGADKIIIAPETASFLNGAGSTDDEGISSYSWVQLSGPNSAVIDSATSAYTDISGLIPGTYEFELTVVDTRGCEAVSITRVYVLPDPFSEAPGCAEHLYPLNGSITSSFDTVVLDWEDVDAALSYDIYLREDAGIFSLVGNTSNSNFTITALDPNTIYHWYVVPKNGAGDATGCDACYRSFVTPTESSVANCSKKRWEVYNTATIEGGDLELYKECEETCYQFGEFAYWQSTEKYPNIPEVWGELCGQFIRHPKFPDSLISHIHDNQNGDLDFSRNNVVYPIGVKVDHDSVRAAIATAVTDGVITQAEADRITGYRIVRGNRFQNKSIKAKGLIFDMNQYKRKDGGTYFDIEDIYFSNYPYNDLRSNPFITDDFRNYEDHNNEKGADLPFIFSKRYTFHSPDTHFTEPTINGSLKLETVEYGYSEGYFTKCKGQAKQRFLSDTSYAIAFTMGIIAALLRTEEKEIKEYTVKGTTIGLSGVFFSPYQSGTGAGIVASESLLDTIVNPNRSASINLATEVQTRTIQGKYKDWVNPAFLAVKKPILLPLSPLMIANYAASFLTTVLQEVDIIVKLIESFTPFRDWTVQYNSVGKYNAYTPVLNNGSKIRTIDSASYLKSENSLISEPSAFNPNQFKAIKVNNFNRESSLYLKYKGTTFPTAGDVSGVDDESRVTLEDSSVDCTLDKRINKQISAYYASIKENVPDQYGSIYNIDYILTDSCTFDINASNDDCRGVYGGDTFIDRFSLKIKVPYFLADTFGLPFGTDFNFGEYPNLAVPRHYYNSTLGIGSEFDDIGDILSIFTPSGLATFLGRPKSIRDCSTNKFFYQNGYIYLYHYGIPYFLVESDVNLAYRHAENLREKAFYPVQSDLDFWLQQENVHIREDNTYFYNSDYSKQNKETPLVIDGPEFDPSKPCEDVTENKIIYATDANWLVYKANDFFIYPINKGKITSIEGIENETVLVRTNNTTSVFKSVLRQVVDGQTAQLGTGGIFVNPPQEFAETTLGYIGSQHKAILHTEFGHITVDAKRGQIFNIGSGGSSLGVLSDGEVSDGGGDMRLWFKENLPFQLLKDFPNMPEADVDNNFYGMGLCMSFDKKNSRLILTKLDYKVKDKTITYDPDTKKFFKDSDEVKLGSKNYFIDKSWTLSYSFLTKSWISVHSYRPNYYIDFVEYFLSGQEDGAWIHNMTNSSFQVFYGKLNPFIFEPMIKFEGVMNQLNSLTFDTEVRRYNNEYDYVVKKNIPGINKMVIYNDLYSSGQLNLVDVDKNDFSQIGVFPRVNLDSWDIEISQDLFQWNLNQFYNLIKDNSETPLWIHEGNNIEKRLNPKAFDYFKDMFELSRLTGQWFKVRMINDKWSNYKVLHKFNLQEQTQQI